MIRLFKGHAEVITQYVIIDGVKYFIRNGLDGGLIPNTTFQTDRMVRERALSIWREQDIEMIRGLLVKEESENKSKLSS